MKRFPSVDTIESVCGVDRETAIKVRRLLDGRDDPMELPGVSKQVAQMYNPPRAYDLILMGCDELLDTCGIEAINAGWHGSYFGDIAALYCNSGDAYGGTILFDVDRDAFYATSWADWVETAERNGRYRFQ